jgi:predicted permease
LRVMAFTLCIIAGMFALSALAARIGGYSAAERRSLQLATMFYNSGNYGIPLMTLAFPGSGPVLQVFVILTQNISTFTIGLLLAVSTHHSGWRRLVPMLRQVSIWAVGAAVLVRWLHIPVEQWTWLWVPLQYLAAGLVAVALVTLGAQLSQTKHDAGHRARLGWALGLRLAGGPLLALLLVQLFDFRGESAAVMILSSAFPTAVNTALLAHEFRTDANFAAAVVFYSTLGSMFTVTALVAALRLWG